jgi:hypothetical protein
MNDKMSGWYRIIKSNNLVFGKYIYIDGSAYLGYKDILSGVSIHQYRGWFLELKNKVLSNIVYVRDDEIYEKISEDELFQIKSEYL